MAYKMHIRSMKKTLLCKGYTILELMVIIAIIGILVAVALPGLRETFSRNARDGAVQDLLNSLALTRSEAVTGNGLVSICRSTDQTSCAATEGADWSAGWIVFTDTGVAGTVDGTDTLIQVSSGINVPVSVILANGAGGNISDEFLQFNDDGFLNNVSIGAYYKFCGFDNIAENARAIWITNTGRAAMSVNDGSDGIHNDFAGANLTCP